jgi:hypothetical protein
MCERRDARRSPSNEAHRPSTKDQPSDGGTTAGHDDDTTTHSDGVRAHRNRRRATRPNRKRRHPRRSRRRDPSRVASTSRISEGGRDAGPSGRVLTRLHALEGRSYAEIAQALELSIRAVESAIFRARSALREQMMEASLTCDAAEASISLQLDGRLRRSDRAALRAHLREFRACARWQGASGRSVTTGCDDHVSAGADGARSRTGRSGCHTGRDRSGRCRRDDGGEEQYRWRAPRLPTEPCRRAHSGGTAGVRGDRQSGTPRR